MWTRSKSAKPVLGSLFGSLAGAILAIAAAKPAAAASCTVPDRRHPTIQSAVDDSTCTDVRLGERTYSEQVTLNRPGGIEIRGVGAGRTIIASPTTRARSTVSTSFLSGYTYVVQVRPGTSATLSDLTVNGAGNARCSERYFGVRFTGASGELNRVVVENVRGRGTDFACANVIAVAVTSESGSTATAGQLAVRGSTIRSFQQIGLLANGQKARLTVSDTVVSGVGPQSSQAQVGIQVATGAKGVLERATISDLLFSGDPCRGGLGTGFRIAGAGETSIKQAVLRAVDRGVLLSKNTLGPIKVSGSRFIETLGGILSTDNGPGPGGSPIIEISKNGFIGTKRSTAATVTTCFDDSGDAIAVRNEKDSLISENSAADSARCAVELLAGTSNLDVRENQAVRSGRADLADQGSGNRLSNNLCLTSIPADLCSGAP